MHEILKNRRSIRRYKPEQVTDAHLDAILEAGIYAQRHEHPERLSGGCPG